VRRSWYSERGSGPVVDVDFRVEVVPERDVVRVCPAGELDLATVGMLRAELEELQRAGFRRLVLDLSGITFIDSSGLHLVVEVDAASAADGVEFGIVAGPPPVHRAFEITRLAHTLPFAESRVHVMGPAWR
jgi:anti-sigma B factor antagonist